YVKTGHRAQGPQQRNKVKCLPIELACCFEYGGVRPEKQWRLALDCVNVRATNVNDLVSHKPIHCFNLALLGVKQRCHANCDGKQNNPQQGQTKSSRTVSWHTHRCANQLGVVLLRES